ncbi:MAG TPA: cellulase family glycosylhydrolase, partial [Acetobacteraceae bacterium]
RVTLDVAWYYPFRFTHAQAFAASLRPDSPRQRLTIRFIRIAVIVFAALLLSSGHAVAGGARPDEIPSPDAYGLPPGRLAMLRHGINLTNWFRFPPRTDRAAIRDYLSDPAINDLARAGFSFVRLAVEPAFADTDAARSLLQAQIARLERHGLAVVIALHPRDWHLESSSTDRIALFSFWDKLAPALRGLDPQLTFPELLNEPVFPNDADGWAALQDRLRQQLRAALPHDTIVLTGNDWGSIGGLQKLMPDRVEGAPGSSFPRNRESSQPPGTSRPLAWMPALAGMTDLAPSSSRVGTNPAARTTDPNVIYSFHFYDPVELTSLAAWHAGLDRSALARLPFPAPDPPACDAAFGSTDPVTTGVARFYCDQRWTAASLETRIAAAALWAGQHHVALLAGEFGATAQLNRPARLAWLQAVRQACDAAGIGWALWGYDDAMGFNLSRPPPLRPPLDGAVLRALGLTPIKSTDRPAPNNQPRGPSVSGALINRYK